MYNTSRLSVEVMKQLSILTRTPKYEISFPLSQSSSLPFIPEVGLPCNDILGTLTKQYDLIGKIFGLSRQIKSLYLERFN